MKPMKFSLQMQRWAAERVALCGERVRRAKTALSTAQEDLGSIESGWPTGACLSRFTDWKAGQSKDQILEASTHNE